MLYYLDSIKGVEYFSWKSLIVLLPVPEWAALPPRSLPAVPKDLFFIFYSYISDKFIEEIGAAVRMPARAVHKCQSDILMPVDTVTASLKIPLNVKAHLGHISLLAAAGVVKSRVGGE